MQSWSSPFTSVPWSPHLSHVTINTHSQCSGSDRFPPSSLLQRASEYCHCRSDCVPGRESLAPAEAQPTRLGRSWEDQEGWWWWNFLASRWGMVLTAHRRGVYIQMGYRVSSVSWTQTLPKANAMWGWPASLWIIVLKPAGGLRDHLWKGKDVLVVLLTQARRELTLWVAVLCMGLGSCKTSKIQSLPAHRFCHHMRGTFPALYVLCHECGTERGFPSTRNAGKRQPSNNVIWGLGLEECTRVYWTERLPHLRGEDEPESKGTRRGGQEGSRERSFGPGGKKSHIQC